LTKIKLILNAEINISLKNINQPIRAQFASLCSRKGIRETPMKKYWKGKILMK